MEHKRAGAGLGNEANRNGGFHDVITRVGASELKLAHAKGSGVSPHFRKQKAGAA
jgi:hypothetical protein